MNLFFIKRSTVISVVAIIVFGLAIGVYGQFEYGVNANMPTVVIDAGHGGIDVGVKGVDTGIKESDVNLAISRYLRGYFANAGFNTFMTRRTQGGLYGLPTKGFKMRDMQSRKTLIDESQPNMVISVHQNFYSDRSRRGGQAFFDKNSESGKHLAESIQNKLNAIYENSTHSALVGDYFMLKCTQNPSVIVECGFLSNPEDEALLITEEYQQKIAYAIFQGAIAYLA